MPAKKNKPFSLRQIREEVNHATRIERERCVALIELWLAAQGSPYYWPALLAAVRDGKTVDDVKRTRKSVEAS